MRISAIVDMFIKNFADGVVTRASSYAINAVFDKYPDNGQWFATQRPGINIFEDASATVVDALGRGVFFWELIDRKYFVNNGTVYQTSYSGATMSISPGSQRVYFFELGNKLVILDPENNEGWTIDSLTPTVITQITDLVFPPNQTPALQLTRGGAVLNGRLYVGTTDGDIYESNLEEPTAWNGLAFVNAEISPDDLVYVGEHHQHIVAIGTRSLEFFYDAGNPTGSSLSPRTDIDFNIGATNRDSFWEESDLIFWIGYTKSGGISVYSLQNFVPTKISKPDTDTFLGASIAINDILTLGSGFQVGGRIFYILTLYKLETVVAPRTTLVYELTSNRWYFWELEHTGIDDCPLVAWTNATDTRLGEGILSNGDLVTPLDTNNAQDTIGASRVFEEGVFEPGVFAFAAAEAASIGMELVVGSNDFGNRKRKFQSELWVVATPSENPGTLNVAYSDEADANWQPNKPIDSSNVSSRLRRLGKFRQRNYRLQYREDEQYRIEGIETTERLGNA